MSDKTITLLILAAVVVGILFAPQVWRY